MGWGEPSGVAPARRLELRVLGCAQSLAEEVENYLTVPTTGNQERVRLALVTYKDACEEHRSYFR